MRDAMNRELQVGDLVLIPARVVTLAKTDLFCNVALETLRRRRPDDRRSDIGGLNTGVLFRANEGDENPELLAV